MPLVLGVDGCPAGWCAVTLDTDSGLLSVSHLPAFADALSSPARIIAVDIPIGLTEGPGGRDCDREARAFLGWPRRNSVFSPPARGTLAHCADRNSYLDACAANRESTGKAISLQSFGIARKIDEVDRLMSRDLERVLYEAHPEVSFAALALRPMEHRKSMLAGRSERWRALRGVFPGLPPHPERPPQLRAQCELEDYIDALVCAWTAKRILEGACDPLPENPQRDSNGLRMAIWRPRP